MQDATTALLQASIYGHRETAEVLLSHKADVNAKNKVSRGEGAHMGAKRPWTGCWVWGYGLVMMNEG